MGDSSVATDNATVANGNTGQDCAELTDPDVILDDDGFACCQSTLNWWNIRTVRMIATIDTMIVIRDVDFAAHEHIIANLDVIDATDMDVFTEAYIIPDNKLRCKVLCLSPPYVHMVSIQSPLAAEKRRPICICSVPLILAS